MSNFQGCDPWRPGAAVQPAAAPVPENPPARNSPELLASGEGFPEVVQETSAETPQEPSIASSAAIPPGDDAQAAQDELERALAEMRGEG